jgi:hypothetical protein
MQETRGTPLAWRLLRDQVRRKVEVELADEHPRSMVVQRPVGEAPAVQ